MPGDVQGRFCDKCEKTVHDLSSRTEAEVRAMMREAARRGERVCVRFAKTPDGGVRLRGVGLGVGLAATLSLAACTAPVEPPPPQADPAAQPAAAPPEEDHDMGDAILDEQDRCPDEPDPNDGDGCPEPPKK